MGRAYRQNVYFYRKIQKWMPRLLVASRWYEAQGSENIPKEGPVLLVANHASYADPPLIHMAVERPIRAFAKMPFFRIPVFGAFIRAMGAVPVDRNNFTREQLRTVKGLLHRGELVLIFPEGGRVRQGGLAPFLPGVGLLAREPNVVVIPVAVHGAREICLQGPRFHLPRPPRVRIAIGKPVDLSRGLEGLSRAKSYARACRLLEEELLSLLRQSAP